jgi:murein DD-endopeptidase MepM/ murein hydrolase activator NlpD
MTPNSSIDKSRFAVAGVVLVAASIFAGRHAGHLGGLKTAPPMMVTEAPYSIESDTLHAGETVSQLFARRGVNDVDWSVLGRAVRNFDPSRLRSGTVFNFTRRHGDDAPTVVAVRASYDSRLRLERSAAGDWAPTVEPIAWRSEPFVVEGVVSSSVSDAITSAVSDDILPMEARVMLVWSLADVFDWSVDFSRDVQPGDRFKVLAERMVSSEGEVRYGRVLSARLDVGPKPMYAFRFDNTETGREEFYDERGTSLKRELLRAPLEFKRISSGFSKRRFHPILRVARAHQGIDFSAAYGAPIRSVGVGTVTVAGRMGGYGNLVEVRHSGNRTTRYAHLSNFGQGIRVGAHVEQGQTVGFVGASGLATAPHLHYELRINGVAVNPRRQFAAGEGTPLAEARRPAFLSEKSRLMDMMEPQPAVVAATRAVD